MSNSSFLFSGLMMAALRFWRGCGITGATACLVSLIALSAPAEARQVLSGHVPAAAKLLQPVAPLDGAKTLHLAIGLPLRRQDELHALLRQIYDPASPNYRQYLTPAQFTERFGPAQEDYDAVAEWANTHNLTVTATHPNRVVLDVQGKVSDIQKALGIKLRQYNHPQESRRFYAPDREPELDLAVPIQTIEGLNNYALPRPMSHGAPLNDAAPVAPQSGSGPSGTYRGSDFRAAYVPGTTLTGSGQSVGLLEYDGYYSKDIATYATQASLPNIPLTNIAIDGGITSLGSGDAEVSLDIEMIGSMAPGVSMIYVYEAPNPSPWVDLLSRMANDNLAKQLSCSWSGGGTNATAEGIFMQMAAQGQSFFNAVGDSDAFTGAIPFPSESTNITEVGGTTLTTSGPVGTYVSETVWNWGLQTDGSYFGSSGGISTDYAIPAYQTGLAMSQNLGSSTMRNVPDVALTADNVYVVYGNGMAGDFGGTSCAAPLWAAFTALVNQQAASSGLASIGFLNPAIYSIGKGSSYASTFHDTVVGNNFSGSSPTHFPAVAGYDLCTGWGSPAGTNLINALAPPAGPPTDTPFVTGMSLGTLRSDYGGYVGMKLVVGANPITVTQLGRIMASGNTGNHTVKLVNGNDGSDVTGGSVSIAMSGGTVGQFTYTALNSPVTLIPGATYYLVSEELVGGDEWCDINTALTTTSVAADTTGAYGTGPGAWFFYGSANHSYVPVNFRYSTGSTLQTLAVNSSHPGSGVVITVTPNDTNGLGNGTTPFNRAYPSNTVVSLTAPAIASGNPFQKWQQDGADWSTTPSTTVTMGAAHTMTVIYTGAAAPPDTAFVTGFSLGTLRSDYGGYVGMQLVVGDNPITVTQLGRIMASGNTGTHTVKLVNGSDGSDVVGGTVAIGMSGGTAGQFVYAPLVTPVILNAGASYYLVSQEAVGGDTWYDVNTTLTTASVAADTTGEYGTGPGAWYSVASAGHSYVPVDFRYSTGSTLQSLTVASSNPGSGVVITVTPNDTNGLGNGTTPFNRAYPSNTVVSLTAPATASGNPFQKWQQDGADWSASPSTTVTMGAAHTMTAIYTGTTPPDTAFVTGFSLGTLRSDYGGYVGMKLVVGANPITVTQLGRIMASGNTGTHTVKLVNASDGSDVAGGTVAIGMSGGTVGQFTYAALNSSVTLSAGATYYLVSQEVVGGDEWYDVDTALTTRSVASDTTGAYGTGPGAWFFYGSANHSYVPMDFKYSSPSGTSAIPAALGGANPAPKVQPPGANITVAAGSPSANLVALRLAGQPGKRYVVQFSTDLIQWSTLDNSLIENTVVDLTDTNQSGFNQRFYRLAPQPPAGK